MRTTPVRAAVRAAVLVEPGRIEVREFPVPSPADDTATIAVELCGACGTDRKYLSGSLPAPLPIILGHEIVGRVEAIGSAAAARHGVRPGDRVLVEGSIPCWACEACRSGAYRLCPTKGGYGTRTSTDVPPGLWGGMSELLHLAPGSIVHRLPDSVDPRTAVGIPLIANGLMWLVRHGGLRPGGRVLIQGCGPQGLAAAMVAAATGATEVTVTGLPSDVARLDVAARVGARAVVVDPAWGPADALAEIGRDFDVVLDVSGSPAAIGGAPNHVRAQGTFVLAGLVGRGTTVSFATDDIAYREVRIQGVLTKDEAAIRSAMAMVELDAALAAEVGRLITHEYPLERAAEAIEALAGGLDGFVKAAVRPAG